MDLAHEGKEKQRSKVPVCPMYSSCKISSKLVNKHHSCRPLQNTGSLDYSENTRS